MRDLSLRLLLSTAALFIFAATTFAQNSSIPPQGQCAVQYYPQNVAPERSVASAVARQQGQCATPSLNINCGTPRPAYRNHGASCTNCGGVILNGNCNNNNCFVKNGSRRLPLHPQGLRYQDTAVTQNCQQGVCFHGRCSHGSCPLVCQTPVCEKARATYFSKYDFAINHQHSETCQFGTCPHGNCPLLCPDGNCPFVRFRNGIGQNVNVYSGEIYDTKGKHVGYTQGGRIYDLDGNPMGGGQNVNVYNGVVYNAKGTMIGFSRNGYVYDSKGNVIGNGQSGSFFDSDGNPIVINKGGTGYSGSVYNAEGNLIGISRNGNIFNANGNQIGIGQQGLFYDANGNQIGIGRNGNDYNGSVYDKTGNLIGFSRNGNVFNANGNQIGVVQQGLFYDANGNQIGIGRNGNDYNGSVYDKTGNLIGFSRNGVLYDANGVPVGVGQYGYTGPVYARNGTLVGFSRNGYVHDVNGNPVVGFGAGDLFDGSGNVITGNNPSPYDDWWFLRPREMPVFGLNPLVPTHERPYFPQLFKNRVFGQHPLMSQNTAPEPDLSTYTTRGPRDFFLANPTSIGY